MEGIPATHVDEATHEVTHNMLDGIMIYLLIAGLGFVTEMYSWGAEIDLCVGKRLLPWADPSLAEMLAGGEDTPSGRRRRALKALTWYVTAPPRTLLRIICAVVLLAERLKKQTA